MKIRTVNVAGKTFQVHELKSWPRFYRPVDARIKTYEVRRDDRGFKVGDRLWLREWDPEEKEYTGDSLVAEISHVLTAHEGLTKGLRLHGHHRVMKPPLEIKTGGDLTERREAVFSECGNYRYILRIIWDESLPLCQFIGLNPSTADELKDDPTVRRCKSFARSWGHGGLLMTNVFAYRATDPDEMMRQAHPLGPANMEFILEAAKQCTRWVAAWGTHGDYGQRGYHVGLLLQNAGFPLTCFKLTRNGQPYHPLYMPAASKLQAFDV